MELGDSSSSASRGEIMTKQKVKAELAAAEGDDFAFPGITNHDDDLLGNNNSSDHQDEKKKRAGCGGGSGKKGSNSGGGGLRICQAEKCTADLTDAKQYHRRHKVCEHHAKAQVAMVAGIRQRFCQQCSRFHELSEFDEAKRSCRRRLAGHNERRRKSSTTTTAIDSHAEGSSSRKGTGSVCGQVDDHRGRIQIPLQDNPTNYKHFQIR